MSAPSQTSVRSAAEGVPRSSRERRCRRCREPVLFLPCVDGSRRTFDPTPVDVDPDTLVAAWAWRRRAGMESGAGRLIEHFPEQALMLHCCPRDASPDVSKQAGASLASFAVGATRRGERSKQAKHPLAYLLGRVVGA
jgi:hypothetical protein